MREYPSITRPQGTAQASNNPLGASVGERREGGHESFIHANPFLSVVAALRGRDQIFPEAAFELQ
jgi:hypothetical protein